MKLMNIFRKFNISFPRQDDNYRKKLQGVQSRFAGALSFLKKTSILRRGKTILLDQLPWYLLLGPSHAGKTTLLQHCKLRFILQPQKSSSLDPSENVDWWVTKDANYLDVPSFYLSSKNNGKENDPNNKIYLWSFFLKLIKKKCGKKRINGIVMVLPLPEILKQNNFAYYQTILQSFFDSLLELQALFSEAIPCQLVITKCDLLPGFCEFFAESGSDEKAQAWGITLPPFTADKKWEPIFLQQFNGLIKRLNEQLLWRLHHEHDQRARPLIKDFPLHVERLKEHIFSFIKEFLRKKIAFPLQGIYLTSAEQDKGSSVTSNAEWHLGSLQLQPLLQAPKVPPQTFFIKQLMAQVFCSSFSHYLPKASLFSVWMKRLSISTCIFAAGFAIMGLSKDFEKGMKNAYAKQEKLASFQTSIQEVNNHNDRLFNILKLLDSLQATDNKKWVGLNIANVFSFYSRQSKYTAGKIYEKALQTILLPEIKNYFQEYLRVPADKTPENIYATLSAYLMLSDLGHLQADKIIEMVQQLWPRSNDVAAKASLIRHTEQALRNFNRPFTLDSNTIFQARKFLVSIPSEKLGYLLLKNIGNNYTDEAVNLGNAESKNGLVTKGVSNHIPWMFTAKAFNTIFSQEIQTAAHETIFGNWILGTFEVNQRSQENETALIQQLRTLYVNNYVDVWESLLANVQLVKAQTLQEANEMLVSLSGQDSTLLQLLQTFYQNTYFDPIASASPKLLNLSALLNKQLAEQHAFDQIFVSLRNVHQLIDPIATAPNSKKIAFEFIERELKHIPTTDAISELLKIADKSPEPLKNWLLELAHHTWHLLMKEALSYLDMAWKNEILPLYEENIAHRYPFNLDLNSKEVDIKKFISFFGDSGVFLNFYNHYLQAFIDTSQPKWVWRSISNRDLFLSPEMLTKIEQAMRIHQSFFPLKNNKLQVELWLQPYKWDKTLKHVKLTVGNKQILDNNSTLKSSHKIIWPNKEGAKLISVEFKMSNKTVAHRYFTGHWGWLKLIKQSFDSVHNNQSIIINLSGNQQTAKYLLRTNPPFNPMLSFNLYQFHLPQTFMKEELSL